MNRPASSKFVPGLPADDDIDTQTNSQGDNSIKIYDGIADCPVNDSDTFKNVKLRAKDLAIQKVKQKIADYVYGFWKDRYLTLPDDEVLSIASEICTITDVKYNFIDSDDNTLIRATVLAQIDDNDVMNYIIQFFKERNKLKLQNEALRKEIEDLKRQIAELKSQHTNNQKITLRDMTKDKISVSVDKFEEAERLYYRYKFSEAIKLYDEAIQINPNAKFYYHRGCCYRKLGNHAKAQSDFKKAKALGWKD